MNLNFVQQRPTLEAEQFSVPPFQGQQQPMPEQPQGLLGRIGAGIKRSVQDPNFMDRLTIGLGGMTMRPNEALMSLAQDNILDRREQEKSNRTAQMAVQMLRSMGQNEAADMVEANPAMAGDFLKMAMKQQYKQDNFYTMTGAELNSKHGSNVDPDRLFKVDRLSGEITDIGGSSRTKPSGVQEYEYAKGQGYQGSYEDWKTTEKALTPSSGVKDYEYAKEQGFEGSFFDYKIALAQAMAVGKPLSLNESNATTFYDRALSSQNILMEKGEGEDTLEMAGTYLDDNLLTKGGMAGAFFQSEAFKRYDQAKRNFINAQLRRESGAAIGKEEFANADVQYFPLPNDPPSVIEQKRNNRASVIEGLRIAAGKGVRELDIKAQAHGMMVVFPSGRVVSFPSPEVAAKAAKEFNLQGGQR